ncbi:metal-dependent phosphohydrolase [Paraconexibacter sp. AEG42_29]|uniref:Metal-dependent phosphohydrolase n=1 Tax=Paraconexibacter sp. AEG42_29 TaxID=2997339 RepID=A0AAU7B1V1_9ACTN
MSDAHTKTPLLTPRFEQALVYATRHHSTQLRKGTPVPYVAHLLGVASIVLEMGGTEDEAIGGLLHDVIEDGGGARAELEIRKLFGEDVARIVVANSDTDLQAKPPWYERKLDYIGAIAHKRPDELRVSLADKLHNARSVVFDFREHGFALWKRFNRDADVPGYYRALASAFARREKELGQQAAAALRELERTVDELDRLVVDEVTAVRVPLDRLIELRQYGQPLDLGKSTEAMVLTDFVDKYVAVQSPFAGLKEAPMAVHRAWERHQHSCADAAHQLQATMRPVLEELYDALPAPGPHYSWH